MNIYEKPLIELQEISALTKRLNVAYLASSNLIEPISNENKLPQFRSSFNNNFHFKVSGVSTSNGKVLFKFVMTPEDSTKIAGTSYETATPEIVEQLFYVWINVMKGYEGQKEFFKEDYTSFYADEIYESFGFDDDGSLGSGPIDSEAQIKLNEFLNKFANYIELSPGFSENAALQEIVKEARAFGDDVPKLTKRQTQKRFANLWAKVKTESLNLFKAFCDVAKKEALKKLLYSGADTGVQLINDASTYFHAHPFLH